MIKMFATWLTCTHINTHKHILKSKKTRTKKRHKDKRLEKTAQKLPSSPRRLSFCQRVDRVCSLCYPPTEPIHPRRSPCLSLPC